MAKNKKKKDGEETKPVTHSKSRGLSPEQRKARKAARVAARAAAQAKRMQKEVVGRKARRVGLKPKTKEQIEREAKQARRAAAYGRGEDARVFADALMGGAGRQSKPLTRERLARENRRRWVEGRGWVYDGLAPSEPHASLRAVKNWARNSAVRNQVEMEKGQEPQFPADQEVA